MRSTIATMAVASAESGCAAQGYNVPARGLSLHALDRMLCVLDDVESRGKAHMCTTRRYDRRRYEVDAEVFEMQWRGLEMCSVL